LWRCGTLARRFQSRASVLLIDTKPQKSGIVN
jgi:hypothetical protein